jgi:secondary thiamine-phosphate synthase enzyme
MIIKNKTISFQTEKTLEFIDITEKVQDFIKEIQMEEGIVNIQILHTSAGLIVNENEPLLIEDFKKNIEAIALSTENYKHDDLKKRTVNVCDNECINGHSHCKAIHLLANVTLNIISKELQLGQWQRVFLVELDRPRNRKIQMQIIGI